MESSKLRDYATIAMFGLAVAAAMVQGGKMIGQLEALNSEAKETREAIVSVRTEVAGLSAVVGETQKQSNKIDTVAASMADVQNRLKVIEAKASLLTGDTKMESRPTVKRRQ